MILVRSARFGLLIAGFLLVNAGGYYLRQASRVDAAISLGALRIQQYSGIGSVRIDQLIGDRPALLVFWTTWCAYCREELLHGTDLVERLAAGKPSADLFFVNVREHPAQIRAFRAAQPLSSRIVLDRAGSLAAACEVKGYPAYALLDARGRRLWTRHGLQRDIAWQVADRLSGMQEQP